MAKLFGVVIIFLLAFAVVLVLISFLFLRRFYLRIRQHLTGDFDDETFKKMADKHYRDFSGPGQQFSKDYFKGSGTQQNQNGTAQQKWRQQREQQKAQQEQRRTTHTNDGVTIIDERSTDERRKIFTKDEGEYVDFTEE